MFPKAALLDSVRVGDGAGIVAPARIDIVDHAVLDSENLGDVESSVVVVRSWGLHDYDLAVVHSVLKSRTMTLLGDRRVKSVNATEVAVLFT